MFVTKRKTINEYCEWLFPIIIPLAEQFMREDDTLRMDTRALGFICEMMFGFWCKDLDKCKLKFKTMLEVY